MKLADNFSIILNFTPQGKEQWEKIDSVKALEALKDWCTKAYNESQGCEPILPDYNIIGYLQVEDMRRLCDYKVRDIPGYPAKCNVLQVAPTEFELLSVTFLINYIEECKVTSA